MVFGQTLHFSKFLSDCLIWYSRSLFSWKTVTIFDLSPRISNCSQSLCVECLTVHKGEGWEIVIKVLAEIEPEGPPLCLNFRKMTVFNDNRHLRKMNSWSFSQNSSKLSCCGLNRQIKRSPFCRFAKCQFCIILRCRKIFGFSTKNDQKMISLNNPFLLNETTFEIYSYEKVLQVRLSNVLWNESRKYLNLCQNADGFYTGRRKGNLNLRFLNKVILKKTPLRSKFSFGWEIFRTCMQVFRQIRSIVSGKFYRFCQNSPVSINEL